MSLPAYEDPETRPLTMSHGERLKMYRAEKNAQFNDGMSRIDEVYWKSAIFSREAMTVNHVSAHRYGDRRALGVYRIVATVLMIVLFVFLTIYEATVSKQRFFLTFSWWVSLWTLSFFGLTLLNAGAYFGEKAPSVNQDGSHPFS